MNANPNNENSIALVAGNIRSSHTLQSMAKLTFAYMPGMYDVAPYSFRRELQLLIYVSYRTENTAILGFNTLM